MKKIIFCFIFTLLMANFVAAQEKPLNYGDYSPEYYECVNRSETASDPHNATEKCIVEEYRRTNKKINELLDKIKILPAVSQYRNDKEKSLIANIKYFQSYMEMYCKIQAVAAESNAGFKQCLLDQINTIYVDIYKLYQASENK